MKAYLSVIAICVLALTVTSCHKRALKGSGPEGSETRYIGDFSKVELNGSTTVRVNKSDDYYVVVSGYNNLLPQFETKVKGDRLILQYNDRYWNVKNDNIIVDVYTPYVDGLNISGSGDITMGAKFELDELKGKISGSGSMVLANSVINTIRLDVNGSGNIAAKNIQCHNAHVDISGSGDIYVRADSYLGVNISGSGDVYYYGNPGSMDVNISGSGKVHKRDQ